MKLARAVPKRTARKHLSKRLTHFQRPNPLIAYIMRLKALYLSRRKIYPKKIAIPERMKAV